jgi:hypothetical protein
MFPRILFEEQLDLVSGSLESPDYGSYFETGSLFGSSV